MLSIIAGAMFGLFKKSDDSKKLSKTPNDVSPYKKTSTKEKAMWTLAFVIIIACIFVILKYTAPSESSPESSIPSTVDDVVAPSSSAS